MATIEIDGKTYQAEAGTMLIDVADANGINIPRFCYHKKLSVAASCRMCLVELERAPKPVPACATPVTDGMKVSTRSSKALAAQKAVMEFLLINHPLDCPICDQGGECELQDVAVGYGKELSQYQEEKRVVFSKSLGPLIATDMTRCIHCTRCVRFSQEITGLYELGATGRGEHTKIGTYIEKNVSSELSGNVIDLCPVGALTAKPSRYTARAWEMSQYDGIAPHDSLGSHLHFHVRRNQLVRVVPKENDEINEVWLSDRDRFSYQGLKSADRVTLPMIKQGDEWRTTSWDTALAFVVEGIKKENSQAIGALASPHSTVEELYLFQKLMRSLGCPHIDHRLHQVDISDQDKMPLFPYLGQAIVDIEHNDRILIVGSHLRKEIPLLSHKVRKAALRGARVMQVNPIDYAFNFPLAGELIAAPNDFVMALAGIAKALSDKKANGLPSAMLELLATVVPSEEQRKIAQQFADGKKSSVLLGNLAMSHPHSASVRALAATIAELSGATLGYLGEAANSAGAWLAGVIPHRGPAGEIIQNVGTEAHNLLTQGKQSYVLLNLEPELDGWDGASALVNLQKANFVVSLSPYNTSAIRSYAHAILPIAAFSETSGTYVNCEGRWQSFTGTVPPPGEARPAWKVLRILGNLLELDGFDYVSSEEIRDELRQRQGNKTVDNTGAWQVPNSLDHERISGLQRITELSLYSSDSLVRRASALQNTLETQSAKTVHINAQTAAKLELADQDRVQVTQGHGQVTSHVTIDNAVPNECVLIYGGQAENEMLGSWYGEVKVVSA